jgi:hypothetical protein
MLIGASETTAGIHWAVPNPPISTLSNRSASTTARVVDAPIRSLPEVETEGLRRMDCVEKVRIEVI